MNGHSEYQGEHQSEQQGQNKGIQATIDAKYQGEQEAIAAMAAQGGPNTVQSLASQLGSLGVGPGQTLLVHSSLRALGWTCGGAQAVILGLLEAVGPQGTIVMPAHSGDFSDPGLWENPPVPADWQEGIRQSMPAWRADLSQIGRASCRERV